MTDEMAAPQNKHVLWLHNFHKKSFLAGVHMKELVEPSNRGGYTITAHGIDDVKQEIFRLPRLKRQLDEATRGCDLVHVQYGSLLGLIAALLIRDKKKILSLRGSDWHGAHVEWGRQKLHGMLSNFFSRLSLPFYDQVIVMSKNMKREVDKSPGHPPVNVLADGLDQSKFNVSKAEARQRLGYGDDEKIILFVAVLRDDSVKRYYLAEGAVNKLKNRLPGARMVVASSVTRDEIPYYFAGADVVLMTSTHEGWPHTIKEGLSAGTPFVATDVSDLKELAAKTKTCRVAADNPHALAEALYASLTAPERDENLPALISEMDFKNYVPRLMAIYDQVLADKQTG